MALKVYDGQRWVSPGAPVVTPIPEVTGHLAQRLSEFPGIIHLSEDTSMTSMFSSWFELVRSPEFIVDPGVSITSAQSMFTSCWSMTDISGLFDTTLIVGSVAGMFNSCRSMTEVGELDFSNATNATSMFNDCTDLEEVGPLHLNSATTISTIFSSAGDALRSIELHVPGLTTTPAATTTFPTPGLERILLHGMRRAFTLPQGVMSAGALNDLFTSLGTPALSSTAGRTIDVSAQPGAATCDTSIATAKNWLVTI